MRIGLDARTLFAPQRRGIGKSLLRLYQELAAMRPGWQVIAYHRNEGPLSAELTAQLPHSFETRHIEIPGDRFDAWTQLRLPTAAKMDRVDLLHCPANFCPKWMPVPTLVTIHDLIPLDMPLGRPANELKRFGQAVKSACENATGVVCPSRFTLDRLAGEHSLDARRGAVVPWGVTLNEQHVDVHDSDAVLAEYRMDRPFVLHFGAPDERKNTRGVIEAWAMMRRRYRRMWKLLIVGLDDATRDDFSRLATTLGVTDSIQLESFVPEATLPVLLSCASIMVYPSVSEGFGLPILEAFATATPVVTSDTTSLPEVSGGPFAQGGAAMLVPPGRATSLASAMSSLMKDPMTRAELASRGTRRVAKFDWSRAANCFADACKKAAAPSRRRKTQRPAAA